MPAVPVRILDDPPPTLATMASAANLAVELEEHRANLQQYGKREVRAARSLMFSKLPALAIRLAFDHQRMGQDTVPWQLARQLLLPVDALHVEVYVNVRDEESAVPELLLQKAQIRHHQKHGRQYDAPPGWSVPRHALEPDDRLVTLKASISHQKPLPTAVTRPDGTALPTPLFNYMRYEIHHHLPPLLGGVSHNPVYLTAPEMHLLLLDLMHDIAYSRQGEHRNYAFFGLYLLSAHILILEHHHLLAQPLPQSLRSLYLSLPADGVTGLNGSGKTQTWVRAVEMTARSLPQINPDFFEDQRNWHLNLKAQEGNGGMRDPARLLVAYRQFFEQALKWFKMAIEGPPQQPASANSLSKSAFHPVSRRVYVQDL